MVELWGMSASNSWQLLSLRSDLVSGPHLQALGCLQVRKDDACIFGTLKWGRRSHSQISSSRATENQVISHMSLRKLGWLLARFDFHSNWWLFQGLTLLSCVVCLGPLKYATYLGATNKYLLKHPLSPPVVGPPPWEQKIDSVAVNLQPQ